MDAWLIQPARTVLILAFAIGFPLLAVLRGQSRGPSDEPPLTASSDVVPVAAIPTGRITSVDPATETPRVPPVNPEVQPPPDRFTAIQHRLQDLGATYLLLESLGEARTAYRFHCELGSPGSDRAGRLFEVTDPNPLAAMERVLSQVEEVHAVRMQLSERLGVRR